MRTSAPIAALIALGASTPSAHGGPGHWSYSGADGPSRWAALDSSYRLCGSGKAQSPIDIRSNAVYRGEAPPLEFDYHPSPLSLVDNGHTVQVDYKGGSSLAVGAERYQLVQFHFHHPSEEEIDGKRFDMVAHLVHRDSAGHLAVVAVLLKKGRENPLVGAVWKQWQRSVDRPAPPRTLEIDVRDLLPPNGAYFTYSGSLTTPPCTEGVRWLVLKTPVEVSQEQIDLFAKRYPDVARPLQKLNGRHVIASR